MNKMFFCKLPRSSAQLRLFCFPFGGGGASMYHDWSRVMGDKIEVCALQLPGRETRYGEPMGKNIEDVVQSIVAALQDYQDLPYAFFGYSLGSLLAFEVSRELRRQNLQVPLHLYIAALGAPHLPPPHPPISYLDNEAFVKKVEYYYQPQGEAWENRELREFLLPVLRGDIALYESYSYQESGPLTCPIDVFAGDSDRATPEESTRYWSTQSEGETVHHLFPGGHFFIDGSLDEIRNLVLDSLNQRL
jgi:medium-chain acyl-[acyl-carrier-protein] hydrolase